MPNLPPQHRPLFLVNPVNLKDMFGRIETYSDNRHVDGSPGCAFALSQSGTSVPEEAVHPNMMRQAGGGAAVGWKDYQMKRMRRQRMRCA